MTKIKNVPATSFFSKLDQDLKQALVVSLGFHFVLFVIFFLRAVFSPSHPIQIENAIRVDIVGMPEKTTLPKPLSAEPAPPVAEKIEPAPPAKLELPKPISAPPKPTSNMVNLKKTKHEQEAALKRLEALEKLKNSIQEPKADSTKVPGPNKQTTIKGNQISKGSSLKGIVKLDYQNYNDAVHEHVHRFWNLPQWMANANLSALVLVFVDGQGNVIKKSLLKSSGRPDFDERALKAIESATPFPRPSSDLVNVLEVEGMQIEMSPD